MAQKPNNQINLDDINIAILEESVGAEPTELPPKDRARLNMAYWVLAGVAGLFLLSWAALMCGPADRLVHAQTLFEFSKSFGPPIVTLVLGFYFRSET